MSKKENKPKDPVVEAQIDRTLAKYKRIAPPHMLAKMREELRELLTTHPVGAALMDQARKRAPPLTSGAQAKEGVKEDDDASGDKGES